MTNRPKSRVAKLDAELSTGSSATASLIFYDVTSWADTGTNVTVHDIFLGSGETISSGSLIYIVFLADSRWYITGAECEG